MLRESASVLKRRFLFTLARVILGVGLAAWLVRQVLLHSGADLGQLLRQADKPLLALALALLGVTLLMTTWRLQQLLKVQGIGVDLLSLFRLSLIGQFFSTVLPGAVGGDLVKMGYLARMAPGRGPESVLTVFIDRLMGLLGLMAVAFLACLLNLGFVLQVRGPELWLVGAAFGIGAAAFGVLLLAWLLPAPSEERLWGRILGRIQRGLAQFAGKQASLWQALAVSMGSHSLAAVIALVLGRALGENRLGFLQYYLSVQIANAMAALPLTPAGLGSRDWIMAQFLQAQGAVKPLWGGIPALYSCVMIAWCLLGGVILITAPRLREAHTAAENGV